MTGLVALCQGGLADPLSAVPDMRADVQAAGDSAAKSLVDFKHFLETELLPRSTGSFRLGRARFENVLRYEIGDEIHVDALAEDAQAAMDDTLEEMVVTARELWPTLLTGPAPKPATVEEKRAMVAKVLAKLGDDATASPRGRSRRSRRRSTPSRPRRGRGAPSAPRRSTASTTGAC